jgi:hypothetical protein
VFFRRAMSIFREGLRLMNSEEKTENIVRESKKHTRNEWGTLEKTLRTSGELWKKHSERVGNSGKNTQNEWRPLEKTLRTSGELRKKHSERVENSGKNT